MFQFVSLLSEWEVILIFWRKKKICIFVVQQQKHKNFRFWNILKLWDFRISLLINDDMKCSSLYRYSPSEKWFWYFEEKKKFVFLLFSNKNIKILDFEIFWNCEILGFHCWLTMIWNVPVCIVTLRVRSDFDILKKKKNLYFCCSATKT